MFFVRELYKLCVMEENLTKHMRKVLAQRNFIIERLKSGKAQTEVAKELGITRSAVSSTMKNYERRGEQFLKIYGVYKERIRIRIANSLTKDQKDELEDVFKNSSAHEQGIKGGCRDKGHWTVVEFKELVLKMFDVRVPRSEGYSFLRGIGLSVVPHSNPGGLLTNHTQWRDEISDKFKQWKKNKMPSQLIDNETDAYSRYQDQTANVLKGSTTLANRKYSSFRFKYQLSDALLRDGFHVAAQLAKLEEKLQKKKSK